MRSLIGLLVMIAAVLTGVYVGFWLCFIGGIIQVVESVKMTPVESFGVAIGVAKVIFAGLAGWATFAVGAIIAALIGGK